MSMSGLKHYPPGPYPTPSQMAYAVQNRPALAAKYRPETTPEDTPCATCGAVIAAEQLHVPCAQIETPTFTRHAENLRFSDRVCMGCAWFYGHSKYGGSHRSFCGYGAHLRWPVQAPKAGDDRPTWWDVLRAVARWRDTDCFYGLLTTDTKPRLWPEVRMTNVASPEIYVHAGHLDLSEPVQFDVPTVLRMADIMRFLLNAKLSKRSLWHGWDDPKAWRRAAGLVRETYRDLFRYRHDPTTRGSYIVSLLIAYPTDKDKRNA